jgi:hypothetical protein
MQVLSNKSSLYVDLMDSIIFSIIRSKSSSKQVAWKLMNAFRTPNSDSEARHRHRPGVHPPAGRSGQMTEQ